MKKYTVVKHDGTTDTITNATAATEGDEGIDFLDDSDNVVAHYEPGVVDDWTESDEPDATTPAAPEPVGTTPPADPSSSAAAPTPASTTPDAGTPAPAPDASAAPADPAGSAATPAADSTPVPAEPGIAQLPNAGQGQPPAANVDNPGPTGAVNHLPGGSDAAVGGTDTPAAPPAQEGSW